jgi:hypothetical protein
MTVKHLSANISMEDQLRIRFSGIRQMIFSGRVRVQFGRVKVKKFTKLSWFSQLQHHLYCRQHAI